MEHYVVAQEQDELWWVSHQDKKLYSFPTQDEALRAAIRLAGKATSEGIHASALILPPGAGPALEHYRRQARFSGM